MKSGIYWIVGPTGKAYIGSSQNVKKRLQQHASDLRRGVHGNSHLQYAANKHGIKAFEFSVLEHCAIERLIEREQFYIDSFDFATLYNARLIAESNRGAVRTPEVRAAISERNRKRRASSETRTAMSETHRRRAARPELRAVVSDKVSTKRNTSGYKGVCRKRTEWLAYTRLDGKTRYLGTYSTPELAYTWRLAYLAHLEYGDERV